VEWDERDDGLHARWVMADTDEARKIHRMIQDRFLTGLSVGFIPKVSSVTPGAPPSTLPQVHRRQGRLFEVSCVSVPTFAEAVVEHTLSAGVKMLPTADVHLLAWQTYLRGLR
jgi:HK97 family phage prohead protease